MYIHANITVYGMGISLLGVIMSKGALHCIVV